MSRLLSSFPTRRSSDLGDDQIGFLVIPAVTESELERRWIGLLVEFAQPGLIMLFEHFDGAEINAKETQIPLARIRSEEHTSELQSLRHLVCRLLLEKKN